jgi:hypothetical protein
MYLVPFQVHLSSKFSYINYMDHTKIHEEIRGRRVRVRIFLDSFTQGELQT